MEDQNEASLHDRKKKKAEEKQRQEEEDNSDLEVVDVVQAKPRKPREVTVVELSSSGKLVCCAMMLKFGMKFNTRCCMHS